MVVWCIHKFNSQLKLDIFQDYITLYEMRRISFESQPSNVVLDKKFGCQWIRRYFLHSFIKSGFVLLLDLFGPLGQLNPLLTELHNLVKD